MRISDALAQVHQNRQLFRALIAAKAHAAAPIRLGSCHRTHVNWQSPTLQAQARLSGSSQSAAVLT
jgi:hypothetical protein